MSHLPITVLNKIRPFLMLNVFNYKFFYNVAIINNYDIGNVNEMWLFKNKMSAIIGNCDISWYHVHIF